jgi:hypothetical protein
MRNKKTSTAALDSVREWPVSDARRVPRHPWGARRIGLGRSKDGHEMEREEVPASLGMTDLMLRRRSRQEDAMRTGIAEQDVRDIRRMLPVILQVTLSLVLWTLGGGMAMNLAAEPAKEHRVVYTFAVDRTQTEELQRWVNDGHDGWCRDPQLVAVAAMRRISEEFEEVEAASLPLQLERREKSEAVYTFHSLDGLKTYRLTLRRYDWLLRTAGSLHRMIWVPEKAEIVTRATLD